MQNDACLLVPAFICGFVHSKQRLSHQNYCSLLVPALICALCMQNSDFRTRITSFFGSHTSLMVFSFKTATSAPEFQVSMGPRLRLLICAFITTWLASESLVSMGPSLYLWSKSHCFEQWLFDQNYKSLWVPALIWGYVHSKQRLYDQNYKSVWDPALIYGCVHSNQRI